MGLIDAIRSLLGAPKCTKLVRYQARTLEFKSLGAEIAGVKLSLGEFKTEVKKVEEASELAKALDDYQFDVCRLTREFPHDDPERRVHLKIRIAAVGLITSVRVTLVAFQEDPEGQAANLHDVVRGIQDFMRNVASRLAPAALGIKARPEHGPTGVAMETLERAFILAGVSEGDVDRLVLEL